MAEGYFKEADTDGDSKVSNYELRDFAEKHGIELNRVQLRYIQRKFDRDGVRGLSKDEWDKLLKVKEFKEALDSGGGLAPGVFTRFYHGGAMSAPTVSGAADPQGDGGKPPVGTKDMVAQLAFVVDCTGSMQPVAEAAMKIVTRLATDIVKEAGAHADFQFAFCGYKDTGDADNDALMHDFGAIDPFKAYADAMTFTGGGDQPEDVLGGLHKACTKLSWTSFVDHFIIHVGDQPPHGAEYKLDNLPNTHTVEEVFKEITSDDNMIQYFYMYTDDSPGRTTLPMETVFHDTYVRLRKEEQKTAFYLKSGDAEDAVIDEILEIVSGL